MKVSVYIQGTTILQSEVISLCCFWIRNARQKSVQFTFVIETLSFICERVCALALSLDIALCVEVYIYYRDRLYDINSDYCKECFLCILCFCVRSTVVHTYYTVPHRPNFVKLTQCYSAAEQFPQWNISQTMVALNVVRFQTHATNLYVRKFSNNVC